MISMKNPLVRPITTGKKFATPGPCKNEEKRGIYKKMSGHKICNV